MTFVTADIYLLPERTRSSVNHLRPSQLNGPLPEVNLGDSKILPMLGDFVRIDRVARREDSVGRGRLVSRKTT